jgi:exonuclease-1
MNLVYMMRQHGVIPYLVFDGQNLPLKLDTNTLRRKGRDDARAAAEQRKANGDRKGAESEAQKGITVTLEMNQQLIQACREHKVNFVVAPYEADAQMAYLLQEKLVDSVVTEDSDLLVFGCKEVLFKMDPTGCVLRLFFAPFPRCCMPSCCAHLSGAAVQCARLIQVHGSPPALMPVFFVL